MAHTMRSVLSFGRKKRVDSKTPETPQDAYVVVLAGDRMGETFRIAPGQTAIGRGIQSGVRINDDGISRVHAYVDSDGRQYVLRDAGSTNGTYANGAQVESHTLSDGDKIQIGSTSVLQFTFDEDVRAPADDNLYGEASKDRLTGLFNRAYFENRLESDVAFALRHGKALAVISFNLDNFRQVNDAHGVAVGDTILRDVANRVRGTIRGEDIFARVGGEDFVVICRDVDATRAANAAQRIRGLIGDKPFSIGGEGLAVTISLGVADLGMLPSPSGEALYIASERALASAKTQGRNLACVYDPQGQPTRLV